jgi:DNA-binding LacI/PurR family transcriptional regulator
MAVWKYRLLMQIKMKDIAKKAKVSASAVSLVLNNKPGVGEETRRKILKIASEMQGDSLLEKRKQHTLGSLRFLKIIKHGHCLNSDLDVFIASYIDGIELEARRDGYAVEVKSIANVSISNSLRVMEMSSIQGIIVLGTELIEEDLRHFDFFKIPIVFVDTSFDYPKFDFVTMNSIGAVRSAVQYLYQKGHREIGCLRSNVLTRNFQLRSLGFEIALKELGLPLQEEYLFPVDSTFDGAYSQTVAILSAHPRMPSALICANDIMAYGCIKALKEKGFRIPDDISVIGFDDLPMSSHMEPPLTTIQVSKKDIGKMAVKLLVERINRSSVAPSINLLIEGNLICRDSVRKL